MVASPAGELAHPALRQTDSAAPLETAALSDRQRAAVLLQGAALLAHLRQVGGWLAGGFARAGVTEAGELVNCLAQPAGADGRDRRGQELLRELIERLFGGGCPEALARREPAGRGEARRALRALLDGWQQSLEPLSLDLAVAQILEQAPFLWEERYSAARSALVAEQRDGAGLPSESHASGSRRILIAGPPFVRSRLLLAGTTVAQVRALLTGAEARALWEGETTAGSPDEGLERARSLFDHGKFAESLLALRGRNALAERLLRVACQYQLGQLRAARRGLTRLEGLRLGATQVLELGEVALRVCANSGDRDGVRRWMGRVLEAARGENRGRGYLLAAWGAWDLGDPAAMARHLEAARGSAPPERLGFAYLHAEGLLASARGDGVAAVAFVERALRHSPRRRLRSFEAGRLWNDLVLGRVMVDDLPGAERACRHAYRLLSHCDGPSKTTLALYNLAEVRIRRGRLAGVVEILEQSSRENRLSGNVRGGAQDAELWARYALAVGQPELALEHCRLALDRLKVEGRVWNQDELEVLSARALGWLGRAEQAAACLERASPKATQILEPEERPALWRGAGLPEAARGAAAALCRPELLSLWGRVLDPGAASPLGLDPFALLEPYRAARLVYDLVRSGAQVPEPARQRAAQELRERGAATLADELVPQAGLAWLALGEYLSLPAEDRGALGRLFQAAGHPWASLSFEPARGEGRLLLGSGEGSHELRSALSAGALVLRSSRSDPVLAVLLRLLVERLERSVAFAEAPPASEARAPSAAFGGIVGRSPALLACLERTARIAPRDVSVLILGETGTGKELVARLVHERSPRWRQAFLPVNCAAMSETLMLSELFGHVRGAFTGADRDRAGLFEAARGGTVFLDEIGDLPESAQGMLLRVLQEGEIRRLGENTHRRVDARVLAATHRNLGQMVKEGRFREDLYYRLNVATVVLPPLRERGEDVLLLAEAFLAGTGERYRLSADARSALAACAWPGNVRQLRNVLEVACAVAGGDGAGATRLIEASQLELPEPDTGPGKPPDATASASYHERVDAFRRQLVASALERSSGNRAAAARELRLSRQALSYLVRQLGLG